MSARDLLHEAAPFLWLILAPAALGGLLEWALALRRKRTAK